MLAKNLTVSGAAARLYSDDVFQAYTRTGTGADVTVTTNIDMTQGYMLWSKGRSGATYHAIYDSLRGVTKDLVSNSAAAETTQSTGLKSVTSTSHTVGSLAKMNTSSATYVDFVFRKAAKFFDVVTYTGNGSNRTISHSLGQVPGMIIVKATNAATDWQVYHRGLTSANYKLVLNTTAAETPSSVTWNATAPTATEFSVGTHTEINNTGDTYVAYLFAHDTGADGLIQCGSFTTDGSGNATVTLGWEPQFVFVQCSSSSGLNNLIVDSARGFNMSATVRLDPVQSGAEYAGAVFVPTATGFNVVGYTSSKTFIYLAIRRPNKPPTVGTQVYNAIARTGTGAAATVTGVGFAPDLVSHDNRTKGSGYPYSGFRDRLRGVQQLLLSQLTDAETANTAFTSLDMDGFTVANGSAGNTSGQTYINWCFKRAPKVFDVVCYTGTGVAHTEAHSLGVAPELIIVKCRSNGAFWAVYHSATGADHYCVLDTTAAKANDTGLWNNTTPTASVFSLGNSWVQLNQASATYVAYLFATKAGISKVGSYTGNGGTAGSAGTSQTINCGFTTGSRFVMLKCTSHASDWVVVDTVRGLVAGSDPALSLNTTAVEVTTTDLLDADTSGFIVNQLASGTTSADFNVTGRTYIFLSFA